MKKNQIGILEMKNIINEVGISINRWKEQIDELEYRRDYTDSSSMGEKAMGNVKTFKKPGE